MDEELGVFQRDRGTRGISLALSSPRPVRAANKRRSWIIAIGALLAVVLVLAGIKVAQIRTMISANKSFAPPPESVTSAKVEASQWEASRSAVGTLVAVRAVTVASEVPGLVNRIGFDSGALVHRGDVLVELDSSTEQAQLAAAKADA